MLSYLSDVAAILTLTDRGHSCPQLYPEARPVWANSRPLQTGISALRLGIRFVWTSATVALVGFQICLAQSMKEALDYQLHPALEMTLFAGEPNVVDPVALTFDEKGKMYVLEMRDYPLGIGPERRAGGTVRLLEDRDGDGQIDRATLFAEGLSFPTSIAPWKGGVLVTAPPEIVYLKDNDNDGKADLRDVFLRGFTLGVTDSNVNGLRWGLDNRVHGANGGNGGEISSPRNPAAPVSIRGLDFSFDPSTGDFTTTYHTSGGFGLVFDDWGRTFTTYNINHIQQRMIPARYLQRFPGFPPIEATVNISDHGEMGRIYPISAAETRVNHPEQAGHFSAAGGMGIINLSIYPGDLSGSLLVCDVVGNLVHRDILEQHGPSFIAKRSTAEQTSEFFASRDNAFRPVGIETGPDGALYLIDMQRDVIEHPDYIPQKAKEKLGLRAGENRGRIYRITPKGGLPARKPNLQQATPAELVKHLSNPNPWWRITAQRLLVERQDKSVVGSLRNMASDGGEPLGRLHALWTLSGLRALDESSLRRALTDKHPGVRENALLVGENFFAQSRALRKEVLALAEDAHPRVRFQTALALGSFDPRPANAALLKILRHDYQYRWSRVAALSSIRSGESKLLQALLQDSRFRLPIKKDKLDLIAELSDLIGARLSTRPNDGVSDILSMLAALSLDDQYKKSALLGIASGLERQTSPIRGDRTSALALAKISQGSNPQLTAAAWRLSRLVALPETERQTEALQRATEIALDANQPIDNRVANLKLLSLGRYAVISATLFSLLEATEPSTVQVAALEVLRGFDDADIGRRIVERWRALAPAVRPAVINLLLDRLPYHDYLVKAIETHEIGLGELNLDLEQRRRLLRESSPEIMARATKLFGDEEYSNRKAVVDEWLGKLPERGDAERGRALFEKVCAQCHVAGQAGHRVGPDLTNLSHRSVEDLLFNILDPNMAINPAYVSYTIELGSGQLESGIIESESTAAITLLQANGQRKTLARKNIVRMQSSGLSLMPEGLEAGHTPADLRDLIAYLQESR